MLNSRYTTSYPLMYKTFHTAWKVSKYGVFSGPYYPVFGLNIGKYRPEKNSVCGHFSRSVTPGFFACICWFYGTRTYIVLWCFWPFLQTSQVRKFWMSKLFLNASDVEDFVYEHIWDEKKAFQVIAVTLASGPRQETRRFETCSRRNVFSIFVFFLCSFLFCNTLKYRSSKALILYSFQCTKNEVSH